MKHLKNFENSKFTFKTTKPTGRYGTFYSPYHTIKLNGVSVGEITHPYGLTPIHKIRFQVIKDEDDIINDKHPNCSWKWITLKKEFKSIEDAKEFISTHNDTIQQKYNLKKEE